MELLMEDSMEKLQGAQEGIRAIMNCFTVFCNSDPYSSNDYCSLTLWLSYSLKSMNLSVYAENIKQIKVGLLWFK